MQPAALPPSSIQGRLITRYVVANERTLEGKIQLIFSSTIANQGKKWAGIVLPSNNVCCRQRL